MTREIDTVPDLLFYLLDRFEYLQGGNDIPLDGEMSVLGQYKMRENAFPEQPVDFSLSDYWQEYRRVKAEEIAARNKHNEDSEIYDTLADKIPDKRKLYDGLPVGLYFAWEMAALIRRQRAMYADKLLTVPQAFEKGKLSRQFTLYNVTTGNWLIFYFSKQPERELSERVLRLVELKLIKEVHFNGFACGVYGLGFQVSDDAESRFRGLACATFNSANEVEGKYSKADLKEAVQVWGTPADTQRKRIEEFPG